MEAPRPVMLHEYGGVPPVAASAAEKAAPIFPTGSAVLVTCKAGLTKVNAFAWVAISPSEFITVTATLPLDSGGTTTRICVEFSTCTAVAALPPN